MSSDLYQKGKLLIQQQTLDVVGSAGIVVIPMSKSYTFSETHDFISDIVADELDAKGYNGGFGNGGRKTPANRTFRRDDPNGRVEYDHDDITWSSLGGNVNENNDVIGGYVLADERSADTDSPLIAFDDLADNRATNGSNITHSVDSEGFFYIQ